MLYELWKHTNTYMQFVQGTCSFYCCQRFCVDSVLEICTNMFCVKSVPVEVKVVCDFNKTQDQEEYRHMQNIRVSPTWAGITTKVM